MYRVSPNGQSIQAEASGNTLAGGAAVRTCSGCSGGNKVGYLGNAGTLTFNNITVASTGTYQVQVAYVDGDAGRTADISVNGGIPTAVSFAGTNNGNWSTPQTTTVPIHLNAGSNTIAFSNPTSWAPDIDAIIVPSITSDSIYEADTVGTLAGGAVVKTCSGCTDGYEVGYIGNGGTLTFTTVTEPTTGSYTLTIGYVDGDAGRTADISVNGATPTAISFTGTNNNNWNTQQTTTVTVQLNAGTNTITFSNPSGWAPNIATITV
jgi:alpha-galactosidase